MTDENPESTRFNADIAAPPAYKAPQAEVILRKAIEIVEEARPMPLSSSSMINKEELLALLTATVNALPDELRAARWLLKERADFLSGVQAEGDRLIAAARTRAERMIQRNELVRAATERAQVIVTEAEDRARRLKLETEDWCDRRLGSMAVVLDHTMKSVVAGRARLQGAVPERAANEEPTQPPVVRDFFDQDDA